MRSKSGIVTSNKGDKTIVVTVHAYKQHPKYKKKYRVTKKFHAHDPENTCNEGETVTIYETKPISKMKRWTIIKPHERTESEKNT